MNRTNWYCIEKLLAMRWSCTHRNSIFVQESSLAQQKIIRPKKYFDAWSAACSKNAGSLNTELDHFIQWWYNSSYGSIFFLKIFLETQLFGQFVCLFQQYQQWFDQLMWLYLLRKLYHNVLFATFASFRLCLEYHLHLLNQWHRQVQVLLNNRSIQSFKMFKPDRFPGNKN